MNKKFDFNDILITPSIISSISSRSEINPYCNDTMLPLITAPMDTVIDDKNAHLFEHNKIMPIIPRTSNNRDIHDGKYFVSYGLDKIEHLLALKNDTFFNEYTPKKLLIDVANGHMKKIGILSKKLKERMPEIEIMVGNIANPKTYVWYVKNSDIDYIRCGIGAGSGCLTSKNGGVGYPMASLISETYEEKKKLIKLGYNKTMLPKIVADGGFKEYSDIIKALYLGADYVMLGGVLNKALESCSKSYTKNIFGKYVISKNPESDFKKGKKLFKMFRGMSTKDAQRAMGKSILKTSEGIVKYNNVEYTISGWVENFESYLRSAMSYTNSLTLQDFIGKANFSLISDMSYKRFDK